MAKNKLTLKDAENALAGHLIEKALSLRAKYGSNIDYATLLQVLEDRDFVRFPARIEFNSAPLQKGHFAIAQKLAEDPNEGFVIFVHEHFQNQLEDVPALVLYHLVTVNYGELAAARDAEIFGAAVLGVEKEDYYQHICQLADQVTQKI